MRLTSTIRFGKFKDKTVKELMSFEDGVHWLEWYSTSNTKDDNYRARNLQDKQDLRKILADKYQTGADISGDLEIMRRLDEITHKLSVIEQVVKKIIGASVPEPINIPPNDDDVKWDE